MSFQTYTNAPTDATYMKNVRKLEDFTLLVSNTVDILSIKLDNKVASLTKDISELQNVTNDSIVNAFKKKYDI